MLLAVALPSETQVQAMKFLLTTTRENLPGIGSFLTVFRSKWVGETYSTLAVAKNIVVYFIGQCKKMTNIRCEGNREKYWVRNLDY